MCNIQSLAIITIFELVDEMWDFPGHLQSSVAHKIYLSFRKLEWCSKGCKLFGANFLANK